MTGPIWAVSVSDDEPIFEEAARLADRLEDNGSIDDRPRVIAIVFDGLAAPPEPISDRIDEVVRLVREDGGLFQSGSAGVRPRSTALRSLAETTEAGGMEQPTAVLLPSTPDGDELAAVAAGKLRGGCVTNCLLRVRDGDLRAGRTAYEGRAYAELSFERGPPVVSLNLETVAEPLERNNGDTPTERTHRVRLEDDDSVRRAGIIDVPEQDLARAKRIVAGGYGLEGPPGFDVVDDLADALGASIGASRPPADEGWVPYDRQIGVTGKEIDVDLYVPCAISGDSYHMRSVNADHLISINVDPDAKIFNAADLGIIGDVFEYGPVIAEAIREADEEAAAAEEVMR